MLCSHSSLQAIVWMTYVCIKGNSRQRRLESVRARDIHPKDSLLAPVKNGPDVKETKKNTKAAARAPRFSIVKE